MRIPYDTDDQLSLHTGWDEDLEQFCNGEVSDDLAAFL